MPDEEEDPSVEASLDELIAKKAERPTVGEEDDDEEALLALRSEEAREQLSTKVLPVQANEFICSHCFLVKHRSQLENSERQLCRDCA